MAPTSPSSSDCRVLKLPPELGNRIYEFALIENVNIDIRSWCRLKDCATLLPDHSAPKRHAREPDLLATCHQIRQEALAVFYGQNTFQITASLPRNLMTWFDKMTSEKKEMVKSVKVRCHGHKPHPNPTPLDFDGTSPRDRRLRRIRDSMRKTGLELGHVALVLAYVEFSGPKHSSQQWRMDASGEWTRLA